jgi:lipoprotein NlpD
MLDGQSLLTGTQFTGALAARSSRSVLWMGFLCLVLAGCASRTTRAPVVDLNTSTAPTAPAASGATYVVKPGDTLYGIARANGVDIESLKRCNNIADSNHLAVGQVLKLSATGGSATTGMAGGAKTTPGTPSRTSENKPAEPTPLPPPAGEQPTSAAPTPAATPNNAPVANAPPAAETPKPQRAADAGVINWGWPAQGQVMATFTGSTKGIDIAGNPGDPVIAAADGKVMYSGNGVRGLGNLIIINHTNNFITAYAHNRALLVKTGQEVKKGARIAELGQTDASSPRLHFEIRRQGTPVDPLQYLPSR